MSFQMKITRQCVDETNSAIRANIETCSGNSLVHLDDSISIAANVHKPIYFKRSQLVAVCIDVDIAGVTIYTNAPSGGSPQDTIPLPAGRTLVWALATDTLTAGPGLVKVPFSGDVTDFYITNAGSGVAALKFRALLSV